MKLCKIRKMHLQVLWFVFGLVTVKVQALIAAVMVCLQNPSDMRLI